MESVYIENYLTIPVKQKVDFLETLSNNSEFKIAKQEVVFSEESIILDFKNDSDINTACNMIKEYFEKDDTIKVDKITKMRNKASQMILKFDGSKNYIRI